MQKHTNKNLMRGANKTKQSNQAGDNIIQTKINSKR